MAPYARSGNKLEGQHPNASLTPEGRRKMVALMIDGGWSIEATAERFQLDARTVPKWRDRFLSEGESGLQDRSSRPTGHRTGRWPAGVSACCICVASVAGAPIGSLIRPGLLHRRCKRSSTPPVSAGSTLARSVLDLIATGLRDYRRVYATLVGSPALQPWRVANAAAPSARSWCSARGVGPVAQT